MPKFGGSQPNPPERGKIPPQLAQYVKGKKKGSPAAKPGAAKPGAADPAEDGPVAGKPTAGKPAAGKPKKGQVPPQLAKAKKKGQSKAPPKKTK